ncbi:MAG: phosphate propanoyltransferase [Clostridiaceae bacterium]
MNKLVNVMLSNRHAHLSKEDVEKLFGEGYELTVKKMLTPTEFAAEETVTLVGPKGEIEGVRVLGPARKATQVEILQSDCYRLGVESPVRQSGDLTGSAPILLTSGKGKADLKEGMIVASRHIHATQAMLDEYGLKDKQLVNVKIEGDRSLIFENVLMRFSPAGDPVMHLDTEEGNAAGIKNNYKATILG